MTACDQGYLSYQVVPRVEYNHRAGNEGVYVWDEEVKCLKRYDVQSVRFNVFDTILKIGNAVYGQPRLVFLNLKVNKKQNRTTLRNTWNLAKSS